eukprot:4942498-Ditylum_brightwellii.AAC.1
MARVKVAWISMKDCNPDDVRKGKVSERIGYQEISCHLILDVKMDFSRKAHSVAGGHTTEAPTVMSYSRVVTRDNIRLTFLIVGLNDLDVMSCGLHNVYLNAKCKKKTWFVGGKECGEDQEKVLVIVRAVYQLRSAGALWRAALVELLFSLGYNSTKADPDVWICPALTEFGVEYYEMLCVCVYNIVAVSNKARDAIQQVTEAFMAKEGRVGVPERYLGTVIEKIQAADGSMVWSTSPRSYIKNAIWVVENLFVEDGSGGGLKKK